MPRLIEQTKWTRCEECGAPGGGIRFGQDEDWGSNAILVCEDCIELALKMLRHKGPEIQVPMPIKEPLRWASDYQEEALQRLADEAQELGLGY